MNVLVKNIKHMCRLQGNDNGKATLKVSVEIGNEFVPRHDRELRVPISTSLTKQHARVSNNILCVFGLGRSVSDSLGQRKATGYTLRESTYQVWRI